MVRLALGTVPLFAVIVGLGTALGAFMTYSSVRTAYLGLIESRLAIEAQQVGIAIETALSLGIALSAQTRLAPLLVERAQDDPLVLSIDVHSPAGAVLFSSRPDRVGALVEPAGGESEVFRYRRPVQTDFGVVAGGVLVRYPRAAIDAQIARIAADLAKVAVPAALVAVLAGSTVAFLILHNLRSRARRAAGRLAAAEDVSR